MRVLATSLLVLGLALTVLPASAQDAGQTSFTLLSKSEGGNYVWATEAGAVNPTLTVPASQEITITIRQADSDGIPHNIKVGNNPTSGTITDEGDSLEYKFTSPASGTVTYLCAIHPTTMKGTMQVAGSGGATPTGDGGAGNNDSPGVGALGALLALAGAALLVLRRRG